MLGAIAGDIVGSIYEFHNIKTVEFPLFGEGSFFTDDTVHTVALAECILRGEDYTLKLKEHYRYYPDAGYGGMFHRWASSPASEPYGSFGNGSAMRVSPAGFAGGDLEEVLELARASAVVTHDHPEGVKGAQSTAAAIYLARTGAGKEDIRAFTEERFGYDLSRTLDEIRPGYRFDETCQGTVPEAITAFLESQSFEDALRLAVSLGGDSDTLACITGGIAQAFYGGVPGFIRQRCLAILDERLRTVIVEFMDRYCPGWMAGE
jgi:ADP-ribosylglycohydrolase